MYSIYILSQDNIIQINNNIIQAFILNFFIFLSILLLYFSRQITLQQADMQKVENVLQIYILH